MATSAPRGLEFTGLRELNASLKKLGVTDDAIKTAMNEAGQIVQREAWRIMPVDSGASARTLKVNKNKNKLVVQVGTNKVAGPYVMHATAIGKARSFMTFDVRAHTRRGVSVRSYSVVRAVRNFPYLFIAFERQKQAMYESYVTAIGKLMRGV